MRDADRKGLAELATEIRIPPLRQRTSEIGALADGYSRRLGMDRRRFLRSACGLAASFLAMNRVFGPCFAVTPAEAADPGAAAERTARLAHQLVFE